MPMPREAGGVITRMVELRPSRHRELKHFVRGHRAGKWWSGNGARAMEYMCYLFPNGAGRVQGQPCTLGFVRFCILKLVKGTVSLQEVFLTSVLTSSASPLFSPSSHSKLHKEGAVPGAAPESGLLSHTHHPFPNPHAGRVPFPQGSPGLLRSAVPQLAFPSHLSVAQSFVVCPDHLLL